jgi:DNA polymerase-3 subunit epsilon
MKIMFLDTETTGLYPNAIDVNTGEVTPYHEIVQFSAIVEEDEEIIDKIDLKMRPSDPDRFSERALEKQGRTIEEIMTWPERSLAFQRLLAFFDEHVDKFNKYDKFIMGGYNVKFDKDMLWAFFRENDHKYFGSYFWQETLDVINLVNLLVLFGDLELRDRKLTTVCEACGIPFGEDEAHNSLFDIEQTRKLFWILQEYVDVKPFPGEKK